MLPWPLLSKSLCFSRCSFNPMSLMEQCPIALARSHLTPGQLHMGLPSVLLMWDRVVLLKTRIVFYNFIFPKAILSNVTVALCKIKIDLAGPDWVTMQHSRGIIFSWSGLRKIHRQASTQYSCPQINNLLSKVSEVLRRENDGSEQCFYNLLLCHMLEIMSIFHLRFPTQRT